MKEVRIIGNNIKYFSKKMGITEESLSVLLCQSIEDVRMILAGRKIISFPQLEALSIKFHIPVERLMEEKDSVDCTYAIDCMNCFAKETNRESVLDLIYDYLDVLDSVHNP